LKQAAAVLVYKKGNFASVITVSILNQFCEVFDFIVHDHVSHYFNPFPD
jgi:hypothetical protein